MAISKVILNGTTLMDVTQDTVTSGNLLTGYTAHGADGDAVTGEYAVPSGTINITSPGSTDVTNYATATVAAGSATTPTTPITANPSISVSSSGLITATVSGSQSVTPTVSSGFVTSGTAGTVSVSGSSTEQLTTQAAQTITPTASEQTIASGKYLTGAQTIEGVVCTNLTASNIVSGVTVKIGTATDDDSVASVTGTASGGGGDPVEEKDVNFYDYDGTLVDSYTKTEFAALSAMPSNPSHAGLTAQGWNWSLSDAKTYVNTYGKLDIGQMYITDDGKTRIYITLDEGRLSPFLGIAVNGTATIDWGDGSATSTVTGTRLDYSIKTKHEYSSSGNYVIAISINGSAAFLGDSSIYSTVLSKADNNSTRNSVYHNAIRKVEIGSNLTILDKYAFRECFSLTAITMPSGITEIGQCAFQNCYSLKAAIIPYGVSSLQSTAFQNCFLLFLVSIPNSVTSIAGNVFYGCYALEHAIIPSSVITLPSDRLFYQCHGLKEVIIPNSISSTAKYLVSNCYRVRSIVISNSLTSLNDFAFYYDYALTSITIPNNITSIGANVFSNCYSLSSITIPSGVTTIGASAFSGCVCLGEIWFEPSSPPAVSNSNAWSNLQTDCKIYVPSGSLSAYKSASNYPSSSTYTYIGY